MATAKLYNPDSATPFALSRSKVELYMDYPRCFYLDRRLGIARPPGFPFNLNSAVDALLKREFDRYRAQGAAHPLMTEGGIRAVLHAHPELEAWRNNFRGVRSTEPPAVNEACEYYRYAARWAGRGLQSYNRFGATVEQSWAP